MAKQTAFVYNIRVSRTGKSQINIIVVFITTILSIAVGFIAQKVFLSTLGTEYLGLNSLFGNIIAMLSLADLGIASSIIFHLYRHISRNEPDKIASLMHYYRKACRIIITAIIVAGLIIMPFLPIIANDPPSSANLYIIFSLFLINAALNYLIVYKRVILQADQHEYILNIIHIGYIIFVNAAQIVTLITTQNYTLYLTITIIGHLLENLASNHVVNKRYPHLKNKAVASISPATRKDIKRRIRASIYHNIGIQIVINTDTLIITQFFGLAYVGLYANYYLITRSLNDLFGKIFSAVTASIGNFMVEKGRQQAYVITKNLMFANSWLYTWVAITAASVITPFVQIWLGSDFLLDVPTTIALMINLYCQGTRNAPSVVKSAAGVLYEDRRVPIAESIINLVASLVFAHTFGLVGVFIGTILSNLFLHIYSYPKYVFALVLNRKPIEYIKKFLKYFIIFLASWGITAFIIHLINLPNSLAQLIVNAAICFIVPNLIYIILYRKTSEYRYFKNIISESLYKAKKRIRRSKP